ncbi:hypothetical protein A8L33_03460 [Microbacterium aurantiacum]|nr:hypothetical protein A8L33_03460 [Microbacterium chocolatum]
MEALLATCTYIEHPRSNRIRPSQGDYGIDVLTPADQPPTQFDVWQIKRFATNLASSQKRQIEKSFRRVLIALVRRGIALRNWYLVLPLDPTLENRMGWFEGMPEAVYEAMKSDAKLNLTADEMTTIRAWLDDPTHEIAWKGLDHCEALVAAHPEVPDYLLHDGSARLRNAIDTLASLLRTDQTLRTMDDSVALLQPIDVEEHLRRVQAALDGDPYYRYGFQVEPHRNAIQPEPRLVAATQQTLPDGQTLTYRIYSRFDEATNERPIPVHLQFAFDDPGFDRASFDDWREYGTEFRGPATVDADLPGGLASAQPGQVRIPARPSATFQRRYRLTSPEGRKEAELMFNCSTTTGLSRTAARVVGTDTTGLVGVEFKGSLEKDEGSVSFTAEPLQGLEVLRAVPVVAFLSAWREGNMLKVGEPFGGRFADIHPVPAAEELIHPLITSWVGALAIIQEHVSRTIFLPPVDQVTRRDVREANEAAALLQGQTVVTTWESFEIAELTENVHSGAARLEFDDVLEIRIGREVLPLGTQTITLLSAQITADGDVARAVPLHNNTVHRRYAGPHRPEDPSIVRGRPAPKDNAPGPGPATTS